jgi:hypothetical protein
MSNGEPAPALIVVYAREIEAVAEFYRRTVSLSTTAEEADFIVLGTGGLEIAIVRISESRAEITERSTPPRMREETPIKCSFLVDDLGRVQADAAATGGGTTPLATAWLWRNQRHLDAFDPEGNRVQFRWLDSASIDASGGDSANFH